MAGALFHDNVHAEQGHVQSGAEHRDDAIQQLAANGRSDQVHVVLVGDAQPRHGIGLGDVVTIEKYCWSLCKRSRRFVTRRSAIARAY